MDIALYQLIVRLRKVIDKVGNLVSKEYPDDANISYAYDDNRNRSILKEDFTMLKHNIFFKKFNTSENELFYNFKKYSF